MITLRLRNKVTGAITEMPADIWEEHSLTIGRDVWEILEPEDQYSPKPAGKAIRAEQSAPVAAFDVGTLTADLSVEITIPEPIIEVKQKARRRK